MAMHALADVKFDPDAKYPLRVEMAKANSKPKRSRSLEGDDSPPKTFRNANSDHFQLSMTGFNQAIQPPYPGQLFSAAPDLMSGFHAPPVGPPHQGLFQQSGYLWPTPPPNACTTLFIAGLQQGCTEKELLDLFSGLPGFVKLKMVTKGGGRPPVAWAEFVDVQCSAAACNSINTLVEANPHQFGIRVEFAKAKMGSAPAKVRSGSKGDGSLVVVPPPQLASHEES
eukprot:CAMPEP_0197861584 /NCGR_PEP_ID=MMETSP1438-20131217/37745_1 /TAXON_ID=1461541 /ORGANISM="Pterosperma sp., Strain CCMP1384" /LENGTH=225 /DNA_ID=CAMNT_0043478811 /DNA_START=382 /DNA_END=1059 /DNA_ORIENTATION=+